MPSVTVGATDWQAVAQHYAEEVLHLRVNLQAVARTLSDLEAELAETRTEREPAPRPEENGSAPKASKKADSPARA